MRVITAFVLLLCSIAACHPVGGRDEPAAAGDAPQFNITIHHDQLVIRGDVASAAHEQQLLQAAGRLFSGLQASTELKILDSVPQRWISSTNALLIVLSATKSSDAILTARQLSIRGIGTDKWPTHLQSLLEALPQSVELDIEVVVPDPGFSSTRACARAFASHRHGAINFEESGTAFRNSAYPVLDRLISLADACRDSTILITGHSDASGDETWNRQLSLARAQAVADHFASRGIARDRMVVAGAGSSAPIADNATRYGRSLNRRIEVDFQQNRSQHEL